MDLQSHIFLPDYSQLLPCQLLVMFWKWGLDSSAHLCFMTLSHQRSESYLFGVSILACCKHNMLMNCWRTHELLSLSLPSAPIINNCPTPVPSLPLMLISHLNQHLQEGRLLVSTESDLTWLSKFRNLSSPFHQLVGVPVYEDGAGCRHHGGGGLPVRERQSVELLLQIMFNTLIISGA